MTRRRVGSLTLAIGVLAAVDAAPVVAGDEAAEFSQTQVIAPAEGRGAILGFCVPTGGGLVGITGHREAYGSGPRAAAAEPRQTHRLVWFAADGTEARAVDLDFAATVAGAAADGGVYVAGDGVVAHVSAQGRELARGTVSQGPQTAEEREAFEQAIADKHEAQLAAAEQQVERIRGAVKELEVRMREAEEEAAEEREAEEAEPSADDADDADEASARQRQRRREAGIRTARMQSARMAAQLRQMEAQLDRMRRLEPRELAAQALRKTRQIRAVSGTPDAVFVVASEATGYGYALWRLDGRLEHPEKIVSGLTGCCGQMDVQVFGDRLAIAANRKHCVELASVSGEILGKVGHRAGGGDDTAGFGGCCNPMNTCTAPDGSLLTSESNGVVKRFDADGEFVEIVGTAKVKGGCKNSAIAIEPDGSRLYYMDVQNGSVIVLTRADARESDETDRDS